MKPKAFEMTLVVTADWLLKELLPTMGADLGQLREKVRLHDEAAAEIAAEAARYRCMMDAASAGYRAAACWAKELGATKEEIAAVVGQELADAVFQVVEF